MRGQIRVSAIDSSVMTSCGYAKHTSETEYRQATTGTSGRSVVSSGHDRRHPTIVTSLDRAGYRLTEPRRVVAGLIAERDGHFTAADLVDDARRQRLDVGRATIFRTLELFTELNAVERVDLPNGEHAYVECEPIHHHHVICSQCAADDRGRGLRDAGGRPRCRHAGPASGSSRTASSCSASARTARPPTAGAADPDRHGPHGPPGTGARPMPPPTPPQQRARRRAGASGSRHGPTQGSTAAPRPVQPARPFWQIPTCIATVRP